jgi:hypothetical protein
LRRPKGGFYNTDIDLFLWGLSPRAAFRKLQRILAFFRRRTGRRDVLVSPHAVTLLGVYPHRQIQIVLRCYRSPGTVVASVQLACGACSSFS